MQAGLTKKPMNIEDIAILSDITAPKTRGSYKKQKKKLYGIKCTST
jgi:hypothetical protein